MQDNSKLTVFTNVKIYKYLTLERFILIPLLSAQSSIRCNYHICCNKNKSYKMKEMKEINGVIVVVALLACCAFSANPYYTKVAHNTDPDAKCLDGSTPIIYLHEGGDTKNILFYFLGGGSCADSDLNSTLQNCYQRSKGQFGTSNVWPDFYPAAGFGILQVDSNKSRFYNWTKIVMMYCDGAFHQGNNKSPIKYKDTNLYFRGAVNTRSHIKWADNKYGLANADKIVISGSSAGGIATFLWVDYLRSLVPNPKVVYGIADSGIFYQPLVPVRNPLENPFRIPHKNQYQNHKRNLQININNQNALKSQAESPQKILLSLSNADEKRTPNRECSQSIPTQQSWKCLFIQYSSPTLRSPILFIQSAYDANIIPVFLSIPCLTNGKSGQTLKNCTYRQLDIVNIYRNVYIDQIAPTLLKAGHSLWSSSCSWHAEIFNTTIYDSDLQRVPQVTGLSMREAVENFVFKGSRINNVDYKPWPSNKPCAY